MLDLARPDNMTEAPKLRAPVFGKVEGLRPDTSGHNLVVKVIELAILLLWGD